MKQSAEQPKFEVTMWGTRGSYPNSPVSKREGMETAVQHALLHYIDLRDPGWFDQLKEVAPFWVWGSYGSRTTCLEVRCGQRIFVIDFGTGCIPLGGKLLGEAFKVGGIQLVVLGTHVHLDHLDGAPFFAPFHIHKKKCQIEIDVYGGVEWWESADSVLKKMMRPPIFPLSIQEVKAKIGRLDFHTIYDDMSLPNLDDGLGSPVQIRCLRQNHPQETYGWEFCYLGKKFAFGADNEPFAGFEGGCDPNLVELFRGADVAINDGQYGLDQYLGKMVNSGPSRRGWGHAFPESNACLIREAGVKRFFITHHDPASNDKRVWELAQRTRELAGGASVMAAHEGLTINVLG